MRDKYSRPRRLLTSEHHDPPPWGSHRATSDLPTKTELEHSQWALGFPCHPILPSALAVRIGALASLANPLAACLGVTGG